jgi:hypothetical protein
MIWLASAALMWGFLHWDVENKIAPVDVKTLPRITWTRYVIGAVMYGVFNVFIVYALVHGLTELGVLR